jgi:membrane protease subunit HflC
MVAEAKKNAFIIRGEGDAEAANIYAKTYEKDAEFYSFYRSLQAYKNSFNNKNDIVVVKPDSEFFRFLKDGSKAAK